MKRNRIGTKITVCAFACALPDAAIGPTGDVRAYKYNGNTKVYSDYSAPYAFRP